MPKIFEDEKLGSERVVAAVQPSRPHRPMLILLRAISRQGQHLSKAGFISNEKRLARAVVLEHEADAIVVELDGRNTPPRRWERTERLDSEISTLVLDGTDEILVRDAELGGVVTKPSSTHDARAIIASSHHPRGFAGARCTLIAHNGVDWGILLVGGISSLTKGELELNHCSSVY